MTHIPILTKLSSHIMKTTIEISTPLLRRAKKTAARDGVTLRSLIEEGLARSLEARDSASRPAYEPLVFTKGTGMNPEFAAGGWDKIRDAIYEGRGA